MIYSHRHRKTGKWLTYLDSNMVKTTPEKSVYEAYEYYFDGKLMLPKYAEKENKSYNKISYEPTPNLYLDSNRLLNGVVNYFEADSLVVIEKYLNGRMYYSEERLFGVKDGAKMDNSVTEIVYLDSTYKKFPFSGLVYEYEAGIPIYKQYFGKYVNQDRVYLLPHESKNSLNKPRLGYTYQQRSFIELGYSKRYAKTTKVHMGDTTSLYFDNLWFPGYTLSMLGSWSEKRGNYFGQKALFTYTYIFLNGEAGFVNYTNFHEHDLRFVIGAGLSIGGRFSIMYHYSQPLTSNQFTDISRHSISFTFF